MHFMSLNGLHVVPDVESHRRAVRDHKHEM